MSCVCVAKESGNILISTNQSSVSLGIWTNESTTTLVLDSTWNIRPTSDCSLWRLSCLMSPFIIPAKTESPLSFKQEKIPLLNSVVPRSWFLQREWKFFTL